MPNDNILVRYTRNADETSGTGAISIGGGRPDLAIGQPGYVTEAEFRHLNTLGVVVERVTESDLAELGLSVPVYEGEASLDELNQTELRAIAESEGVDISGLRSNAAIVEAIEEARTAPETGVASLPATATAGPAVPSPAPAGSGDAGTGGPAS